MEEEIGQQNFSKVAIKNSGYTFLFTLVLKLGGLIFTILIARLLLPELFGIYALALSLVVIFITFTNLGVNETFLRYVSDALGKKDKNKARAYLKYLLKIKTSLVIFVILIILLLSKFLSYNVYNKPLLFYPLLFSFLFIIAESFKNFIAQLFLATKNLKPFPLLELLHQTAKIFFSVLAISVLSSEFKVVGLFLALALAGFIHLFLFVLFLYKKDKSLFIGKKESINKKRVNKYLGFMGVASISLVFFGSIDTLMLGKFVESSYLGYYRVALSLIMTLVAVFSLSGVLLPMFTQIHEKRFERGFQKTFGYLMIIIIPSIVGILFIGKYLVLAVYGVNYILATSTLYVLSLLIITGPIIALYMTVFQSKEKTKILARSVLSALIINIILNYVLIKYLLQFSQEYAMIGVGISTVVSRVFLLGILIVSAKHQLNLNVKGIGFKKPIFATIIMALSLLIFNSIVNMNLFFGILEIILGAGIYFGVLILIKEVTKEDFELVKNLIRRKEV